MREKGEGTLCFYIQIMTVLKFRKTGVVMPQADIMMSGNRLELGYFESFELNIE